MNIKSAFLAINLVVATGLPVFAAENSPQSCDIDVISTEIVDYNFRVPGFPNALSGIYPKPISGSSAAKIVEIYVVGMPSEGRIKNSGREQITCNQNHLNVQEMTVINDGLPGKSFDYTLPVVKITVSTLQNQIILTEHWQYITPDGSPSEEGGMHPSLIVKDLVYSPR